jgi:hypothetical protein
VIKIMPKMMNNLPGQLLTHVTQKVIRPSPLAPLPKRERGTRKKLKMTLAPLLPLWEKGLGDEGTFSICVR